MGKTSLCEKHHDTILQLNAQGLRRKDIAEQLDLPRHAVQAYLQRREIQPVEGSRRTLDPDQLRELIEVRAWTHARIAAELGCSRSCVERTAAALGLRTARTGPRAGAGHHQKWESGRMLDKHGYVRVFAPLHPRASSSVGYVFEHRLVMEVVLGRYLLPGEVVDHEDDHPQHNWPGNLRLFASNADHLRETLTGRKKATPRGSIPGAYGSSQKTDHCPGPHETLAQCSEAFRLAMELHIFAHQPGPEHAPLARSRFLRQGARLPVFQEKSTA